MSMKKRATKSIALALIGISIAMPVTNTVFAMESNTDSKQNMNIDLTNTENDVYDQELVENVNVEGVNYTYKYYYNETGDKSVSITDMTTSKTETLTFDEKTSNVYLDGNKIGDAKISYDEDKNLDRNRRAVDSSWKRTAGPTHIYISWAKGTGTAIVLGLIAGKLGLATYAISAALVGSAGILAGQCSGGTLHFTKYYRNLPLGQVQYRTDWSFVASTGDRYGTYTYMSIPQSS